MLLATVLAASLNLEINLGALVRKNDTVREPNVTCNIATVGYRFVGKPGQRFRYSGDTYVVPEEGWIELIANRRRKTYAIDGRSLPLDVWPLDQFGFREVPMPSPATGKETPQ